MKYGVLLVNTGSPDSCATKDVKKYLSEFLMDERVIDIDAWKRNILVNRIIVPFRGRKSSRLYSHIWTENGSPLLQITKELRDRLAQSTGESIYFAMRYGNPAIKDVLEQMARDGIKKIILIPMFPHYAMSTYESVIQKVLDEYEKFKFQGLNIIPPFYRNPEYIKALAQSALPHLAGDYDALIFSYHSLPIRHIKKMDSSGRYCLNVPNCCEVDHCVHDFCYRAQTFITTKFLIEKAELKNKKTYHTFQSAMNPKKWLGPDTEKTIVSLAKCGVKKLIVMCPGFTTDNLETLEEIQIRGRKAFLKHGGQSFVYIPALNTGEYWVKTLSKWIKNEI